jgi:hypothetical protein
VVDNGKAVAPVWTLATQNVRVPAITGSEPMTPEHLGELRTVLAALADSPIATLEVHPLPEKLDRTRGMALDSASPLAQHLSQLITRTAKSYPAAANVGASGEVLYRMVVPAKVAAQVGKGLVRPMTSKAAAGGVHSALVNSSGIAAQATFVPVAAEAGAVGAAGGAAGTAGIATASAGALTVAAPLVLMAVAVGISAYADHQRQEAIERIAELLEKLHEDKLDDERNQLDGCSAAIDKATAILLDQGRVGVSLGLDSAVFAISKAVAAANRRLARWQHALASMLSGPVEIATLRKIFAGIDEDGGEFRAHLELAVLAIALRRRVIVLQAVEHAQLDESNPFENFVRTLKADQQRVDELESGIATVLRRLSTLELTRPHRLRNFMFTAGEVDGLLRASYRLRALGDSIETAGGHSDVAIDIARDADGSVIVFPAVAA